MTSALPRYRTLQLCAAGGGFEAFPESARRLDLGSLRRRLEGEGRSVIDARVMLIVSGTPEMTISAAGRVLIKTPDRSVAEQAFAGILPLLS